MTTVVLLLREPSPPPTTDRYEAVFRSTETGRHYLPISVPVLETTLANTDILREFIVRGPEAKGIQGVVVTSARACDAWKSAIGQLTKEAPTEIPPTTWSTTTFYVVGTATATALTEIGQAHSSESPYVPRIIHGSSSGTSEKLAELIRDLPQDMRPKRVLYLTGDKNKDTIPSMLGEAGVDVVNLRVYETRGSRTFERDLGIALGGLAKDSVRWWIVHFAPSAAEFVTPILEKHLGFGAGGKQRKTNVKVAAIGPVTASFLRDQLRIPVDVVPSRPGPQDLLNAIVAEDLGHVV